MKRLFLLCLLLCRAATAQTLAPETEAKLEALCADPKLSDARIGVAVMAIGKAETAGSFPSQAFAQRKVLFERDAEKRFTPASNMKLYTAALALKSLGAGRRFTTQVRALGKIENGVLTGYLVLVGAGDPALDFVDLDDMARQVRAFGIRKVTGGILSWPAGNTFENGFAENFQNRYPDGWTLDDTLWYYGPEVVALSLHRNQFDLVVTGGNKPGDAVKVEAEAGVPVFLVGESGMVSREWVMKRYDFPHSPEITTNIRTGTDALDQVGEDDLLKVQAGRDLRSYLRVSGQVPPLKKVTIGLAIPDMTRFVEDVFRDQLKKRGVQTVDAELRDWVSIDASKPANPAVDRVVATHDSPPVGELLKKFLKTSDNLYGELLLRLTARADLSVKGKSLRGVNYANYGHEMLRTYLKAEGIDVDGLRFSDGSGLSRYNLVTPRATAQLLASVERIPGGQFFWDAMPIAGVDGTLRKRMKDTPAQDNARAKTGTFSIVSCLSGFVTTKDGTRLVASVMTNFAQSGDDARRVQNGVFETLAGASLIE